MKNISYKDSGVNIDAGNAVVAHIKDKVKATFAPYILNDIGSFAALIDLRELLADYKHPVLVQSIDGVGTKTIVARMMGKYDTLGMDLLSASSNDILVMGAKPLTLLDYIACDELDPDIIAELVNGMVKACCDNNVSLVGGETAEMPDTYLAGEHDLVGIVTGVVEKDNIITGADIKPGDKVLGFMSSGLHTNGYSLARKLFFEVARLKVGSQVAELGQTVGEALLAPHLNYAKPVLGLLEAGNVIKGMAHITGGGLLENIPRVLPQNCAVNIKMCWDIPPVFTMMQQLGKIKQVEMYRTFNMGIGYVIIAAPDEAKKIMKQAQTYSEFKLVDIGEVTVGKQEVHLY